MNPIFTTFQNETEMSVVGGVFHQDEEPRERRLELEESCLPDNTFW